MNILLVYPKTPVTFWSMTYALDFVGKRSAEPPLGLITVAAMLPKEWNRQLIDTNVTVLEDDDILWADYVFLSGMDLHRKSFEEIALRCRRLGVSVVGGGPYCTLHYKTIENVNHFVLNEAEVTLPEFLEDVVNGHPRRVYTSTNALDRFPDLAMTPIPEWKLLDLSAYASIDVQYSRGCPFDCEFCSITMMFGHKPRCKKTSQFIEELDTLYDCGWRGPVFIVDDNFIGNRRMLKNDLLPALTRWQSKHGIPFSFTTEVSINLVDDEVLVDAIVQAGFHTVFVGIETPEESNLQECGKKQNLDRDLISAVKSLQRKGLEVSAGFIVGFDNDTPQMFKRQIDFIQESGIVVAMVGLLTAETGTKLYDRLEREGRIEHDTSGNNTDGELNFKPRLDPDVLRRGYQRIVGTIYSPKEYFNRIRTFLAEYRIPKSVPKNPDRKNLGALLRVFWRIGIVGYSRRYFWKLLMFVLRRHPRAIVDVLRMSVYGFHFRKVVEQLNVVEEP
ncbi:MAG: B12-binding domain-containing radical SAM protein [Spirochaetaceae bacterium]|nr:B12-binding domain-containing radical SAM protein [Spirochaetaceae bacterium]MDT8297228.1 B12-binding domain-containing radical SAM protein [Spirochaetaceae bacterium]